MDDPLSLTEIERLAREALPPAALAYISGGAGGERTLRWNREAFDRRRLRPRVLVDVSSVSAATTVLGAPVAMPVLVAPTAYHLAAHPERELATARASAAEGTIFCLSTISTASPTEVAQAAPDSQRWLQLYVFSDRGVTDALVDEALDAGFTAVVLTVDVPVVGVRDRERDNLWVPPEESVPVVRRGAGRRLSSRGPARRTSTRAWTGAISPTSAPGFRFRSS